MNLRLLCLPLLVLVALTGSALAHEADSQTGPLGKVSFPTSCDPKVQPAFERAVAMLHSFWYSAGEKAFRDVLKDDPQCAIATWGIASILMSNPLAGQGASPKGAEQAQAAIDEGRRIGAKTERERDYIEAVAAYYQDFAIRPEKERQASRARPTRRWPSATRPTTRRRSSPRSTSPGRRRRPTRPTPRTSRRPPSSRTNSGNIPTIPAWRTTSSTATTRRPSPTRGSPPRAVMRASRRPPRTRCTCLRTSSRAWALGRSPPPRTSARWKWPRRATSRTRPITRMTTWCTRTCSSPAMPRRAAASTKR